MKATDDQSINKTVRCPVWALPLEHAERFVLYSAMAQTKRKKTSMFATKGDHDAKGRHVGQQVHKRSSRTCMQNAWTASEWKPQNKNQLKVMWRSHEKAGGEEPHVHEQNATRSKDERRREFTCDAGEGDRRVSHVEEPSSHCWRRRRQRDREEREEEWDLARRTAG